MNIAITRLVAHKLTAALVDDRVSPYIKELIRAALDDKIHLVAVKEYKQNGIMLYQLDDGTYAKLDMSGDVNKLLYDGHKWEEIPEDEIDCQYAVNQLTGYLALTDCLVYLAATVA